MRDLKNHHNYSTNKIESGILGSSSTNTFANKGFSKKVGKQNSKLKYNAQNFFNKLNQENRDSNFSL